MALNYQHLYYFKSIALEGSISKASKSLRVGQPALSHQLKQLEQALDTQLFERRNRSLVLTEAGKFALVYALKIFEMGKELEESFLNKNFTDTFRLKLGVLDSVPKTITTQFIEFAYKELGSKVEVIERNGTQLREKILNHKLDLCITNYSLFSTQGRSTFSRSLGTFPLFVFGAPKFSKLKKNFPHSLNQAPIVMLNKQSKVRHDLEVFLDNKKIRVNCIAEVQDTSVQKILASDALGVVAETDLAMNKLVKEKKVQKIGCLSPLKEEFYMTGSQRFIENKKIKSAFSKFRLKT